MAAGRAFRYSPRPNVVSAIAFAGASCRQPCLRKPQSTLALRAATPIPAAKANKPFATSHNTSTPLTPTSHLFQSNFL